MPRRIRQFIVTQRRLLTGSISVGILLFSSFLPAVVHAQTMSQRQQFFESAAQEFHVPVTVLLAISYNESRWESHGTQQSIDGGYGLMDLRAPITSPQDAKGAGQAKTPPKTGVYTLNTAANLLHIPAQQLQTSDQQNVRGAAAVLASYARELNNGLLPSSVNDWYAAVAQFAGSGLTQASTGFADDVYAAMQTGESATTTDGQVMSLSSSKNITPNKGNLPAQKNALMAPQTASGGAECPNTLNCRFVPAGYAQNSADPTDYGNYDHANRPNDMSIKYIVIHDTEGSYTSAIDHFQDTTSYVSGNYIIRSSDGAITQMVKNQDVSWGSGDWYVNMHAINIEHEGYAAQGSAWYTEAMYKSSATLVRYLANKYNIPLDRQHIIGHDNVPTIRPTGMPGQHWDPGPFWDWNHYMALLHGVSDQAERQADAHGMNGVQKTVTINPKFSTNQQLFSDCQTGTCVNLPTQGSSTLFVRTQPNAMAPLVSDQYVHGDGSAGTNLDSDWGDQAAYGQQFALADQQGSWIAIWYNGQKGWIYNSPQAPVASVTAGHTVTPRAGQATIPVFGAAYPEASAYPKDGTVPVQTLQPLYAMPAGQAYTTSGETLPTDYFYDWTINYSVPHDHMVVVGYQKYYQIMYNHRIAFVRASDVRFQN